MARERKMFRSYSKEVWLSLDWIIWSFGTRFYWFRPLISSLMWWFKHYLLLHFNNRIYYYYYFFKCMPLNNLRSLSRQMQVCVQLYKPLLSGLPACPDTMLYVTAKMKQTGKTNTVKQPLPIINLQKLRCKPAAMSGQHLLFLWDSPAETWHFLLPGK